MLRAASFASILLAMDAGSTEAYPRDLCGYGAHPPHAAWPARARVAVQFVVNYEEGAENSVLHGRRGLRVVPVRDSGRVPVARTPHEHGVDLRVRQPRRRVAPVPAVPRTGDPDHGVRGGDGAGAQRGGRRRRHGRRFRDLQPRLSLDRLPGRARAVGTGAPAARGRDHPPAHRPATPRLVHRAHRAQHAPAGRGGGAASCTTPTTTTTTCRSGRWSPGGRTW